MSLGLRKYPKSHWDPRILDYVGLKNNEAYYKNYVYKCLLNKLEGQYRYGRYELDDDLIDIIRSQNDAYAYYYKYASKNSLNYFLGMLKISENELDSQIFKISFDQNGEDLQNLEFYL